MKSAFLSQFRDAEYVRLLIFRTLGNFLVLLSIGTILKTFGPALYQESVFALRSVRRINTTVQFQETNDPKTPQNTATRNNGFLSLLNNLSTQEEVLSPPDPQFSVVIPKIGAASKVVANVDGGNYDEYINQLKEGVAHTKGTAFPGDGGHIYLFAHSTDSILNVGFYNAVFYLLYKLEQGDEIYLFYQGKKHLYKVIDKKTVDPDEVFYLTRQSNKEFLTLQTCWPPGTTLKRLLVFAIPVVE